MITRFTATKGIHQPKQSKVGSETLEKVRKQMQRKVDEEYKKAIMQATTGIIDIESEIVTPKELGEGGKS